MLMKRFLLFLVVCTLAGSGNAAAITFTSNATVTNHDYGTEQVVVANGASVTFDNVHFGAFNATASSYEGRLQVLPGGSVTVKNSKFGPGGCSDGIQYSSSSASEVYNTEFTGITQGNCSAHVDPIQLYAGNNLNFHDNWVHGNDQGIMAPDGSSGITIKNNVIVASNNYDVIAGNMDNSTITHNVADADIYDGNPTNQPGCGARKSSNDVYRDNVGTLSGCGTNITSDHNLSSVTFTGGSGRCASATASPKGTASDGTDIGLNDCGSTPPPPVDHTPVARFTTSPEPSAPQQTTTFNATSSTCEDTPCVYHWHDIDSSGAGNWPLGPDGATMTFAFQGLGTKYVELVLTDADGDVAKVEHNHVVSNTAPPPPSLDIANLRRDDAGTNDASQYGLIWFFWDAPQAAVASYNLYVDGSPWWEHPTATHWWVGSPSWGCGSTHTIGVQAVGTDGTVGPRNTQTMSTAAC